MNYFIGGIFTFLLLCGVMDVGQKIMSNLESDTVSAAYLEKVEKAESLDDIAMPVGDWVYETHVVEGDKSHVLITRIKIIDSGEFSIRITVKSDNRLIANLSGVFSVNGSLLHAHDLVGDSSILAGNKKVVISEVGSYFLTIVNSGNPKKSFKFIREL